MSQLACLFWANLTPSFLASAGRCLRARDGRPPPQEGRVRPGLHHDLHQLRLGRPPGGQVGRFVVSDRQSERIG
jgi:hypothetical protein